MFGMLVGSVTGWYVRALLGADTFSLLLLGSTVIIEPYYVHDKKKEEAMKISKVKKAASGMCKCKKTC